ncbi:MAG TPA: response regulator transcription factor [Anaerolineaceae bacterium]
MNKERILIIEDERAVARGMEYGLKAEGFNVLWAENGRKGVEIARDQAPQLILLDIRLPDINGFEVCRQLRGMGLRQPILMVTARDEEVDRILGLELGADDYIVKPFSLRELIARVRAALRRAYGDLADAPEIGKTVFGDVEVDHTLLQVFREGKPVALTPIEFRLLHLLISSPGHVFNRTQLLETVWGYAGVVDNARTIDVHMRHLREKLEDDPAHPQWLLTVRGFGYKFQP